MKQQQHLFTNKMLRALLVPIIMEQLLNALMGTVDTMMVSNVGSAAISAVSLVDSINVLIIQAFSALAAGGTIICTQYLGQKNHEMANKSARQALFIITAISVFIVVLGLAFRAPLLSFIFGKVDADVMENSMVYFFYTVLSYPFIALYDAGASIFRAQENTRGPMVISIISNVMNIVGNGILIWVFHMGVAGAAIATVIAQFASCAFAFCFLTGKKIPIKITRLRKKTFSPLIVKKIIGLGISPFLILATDSVIIIVLNTVLQKYGGPKEGDILITCATIVQSYMMLITGPMLGISSGTQAILSYNYGARNIKRVKKAEKYVLILCLCFTTLMFLLSRIVPEYFIRIFTKDALQLQLCTWGIGVFTLMIIPLSFQYVFVDGFTALGRSKTALVLSLWRKGDYMLFTIVLPIFFGAKSAFYAQHLADGIGAVMSTIAFLLIFRKHLEKREAQP